MNLERVEELRDGYGCTEDQLLGQDYLNSFVALLWYRINRRTWTGWADFCQNFRTQFLPRGYEDTP